MIRTLKLPPPANPCSGRWNYGREVAENFVESGDFHLTFICHKFTTWDRRLYFPSEGRSAEDFFSPEKPTTSAGVEPANSSTRGQHAYI